MSNLDVFFDTPSRWISARKPLNVRFSGWVACRDSAPVVIMVRSPGGNRSSYQLSVDRPGVVSHFAKEGREVALRCGFDFVVEIPQERNGPYGLELEVKCEGDSFGPIHYIANDFTSIRWSESSGAGESDIPRGNYKDTWNAVSSDVDSAKVSVAGYSDENRFDSAAQQTLQILQDTVGIRPDDTVLEIGCGVGRMAGVLSPLCQKWIGGDVSENMLEHARDRCGHLPNISFVPLNGWDLAPIDDASMDVVYCTVVFMHLDEWDRFNYICEAMRVLRPGGRIYVDNFNLLSKTGWDFFMRNMVDHHPLKRPANISKSSTPEELCHFLKMAGFGEVRHRAGDDMWIHAWGTKPA